MAKLSAFRGSAARASAGVGWQGGAEAGSLTKESGTSWFGEGEEAEGGVGLWGKAALCVLEAALRTGADTGFVVVIIQASCFSPSPGSGSILVGGVRSCACCFGFGVWQHSSWLAGPPGFGATLQPSLPHLAVERVLGASPGAARAPLGRGSSVGAGERAPSQCASAIVLTRRHMAPSETAKRNPTADAAKAESWQQTGRPAKCLLRRRRVASQDSTVLPGLALRTLLRLGAVPG